MEEEMMRKIKRRELTVKKAPVSDEHEFDTMLAKIITEITTVENV